MHKSAIGAAIAMGTDRGATNRKSGQSGKQGGGDRPVGDEEMRKRLQALRTEHRDLDAAIEALGGAGSADQLQIARLKKRKLKLRDQIALIEDNLLPDIIA
jgi:hypothetical protein